MRAEFRIHVAWACAPCEVEGVDPQVPNESVACWSCGGRVVIFARPTLPIEITVSGS